jgi:hypothetical protein
MNLLNIITIILLISSSNLSLQMDDDFNFFNHFETNNFGKIFSDKSSLTGTSPQCKSSLDVLTLATAFKEQWALKCNSF